jgi:hypothetical protein
MYLSICLSIYLSICLSVCLSVYLSVRLSIYLSIYLSIIITIIVPFMQGIHTYIPETNHVSMAYSVAAILCVLLMVHIALSAILNSSVLAH